MNLNTDIPAPRVSFIDPRTGLMARAWYLFLLDLFSTVNVLPSPDDLAGVELVPIQESGQLYSMISDLLSGAPSESAELFALIYRLRQDVSLNPPFPPQITIDDLTPPRSPLKIEDLNGFVSTNTSLADNSNLLLSTQKAIKTYVDAQIGGGGGLSRGQIIDLPNLPVFL